MRQLCGSVYTWNCAGELYAIECSLCEERPLCALSEFPEHMDVWHSDWQEAEAVTSSDGANEAAAAATPEDELMQEVLAEQRTSGEDNELKQLLVWQLNAIEEELLPGAEVEEAGGELVGEVVEEMNETAEEPEEGVGVMDVEEAPGKPREAAEETGESIVSSSVTIPLPAASLQVCFLR